MLRHPPAVRDADGFNEDHIRGVFYDGLPFHGKPTRVFAWIGLPERTDNRRVPGIVLAHGGGGTAFAKWIRLWTARGYAAIAMDTCDDGPWQKRRWKALDACIDSENSRLKATLPQGTKVYYFNLIDAEGLVVSSEHIELE